MTSGRVPQKSQGSAGGDVAPASLVDALLVYAEPLASNVHVIVIGDAASSVAERLLDLGARAVHVFDPDPARAANAARSAPRGVTVRSLVDELAVRDGSFDLAVVPDLSELNDPRDAIARLRRAVAPSGAVLAMGRAKLSGGDEHGAFVPFATELGPAALEYSELYDIFAVQFDHVSIAGVVPFTGVVFAELGGDESEPPPVTVDTRLAPADSPAVFVVVAGQRSERRPRPELDPYAIVQLPRREDPSRVAAELEANLAAAQLQAKRLSSQVEELRERLVAAESRAAELAGRLDRAMSERDGALTRAMELESVLAASQQTMASLESRLLEAERGLVEREERIHALGAELDARRSATASFVATSAEIQVQALVDRAERAETALAVALSELSSRQDSTETTVHLHSSLAQMRDRAERAEAALSAAIEELNARRAAESTATNLEADLNALRDRAERAEAALALHVADLAHVAEAHAKETESYEEQLRDRARVIAALEKELVRREQLVKELVTSLEESREAATNGAGFEAAPLSAETPVHSPSADQETTRLRKKLDELAAEVARREGELLARAWRIAELENQLKEASGRARVTSTDGESRHAPGASSDAEALQTELARTRDELARALDERDALRQALKQEHDLRVAAESGEELVRARSELARQAALLEQMRGRADTN
jgi:5-formyltetrahydrofolate cyclo-ligase